jgi:hypothetical protein
MRFERQRQLIQQQQHEELLQQQRLLQQRHDDALAQLQRDQEVTSAVKAAALERARKLEQEGADLAARKARFDRQIEEVGGWVGHGPGRRRGRQLLAGPLPLAVQRPWWVVPGGAPLRFCRCERARQSGLSRLHPPPSLLWLRSDHVAAEAAGAALCQPRGGGRGQGGAGGAARGARGGAAGG